MDSQDSLPSSVPVSTSSKPEDPKQSSDPKKEFSPEKLVSPSRHAKQFVPCNMSVSDVPVSTCSKPASIAASNTTINETQDVVKESSLSTITEGSSLSDDDSSLGLLSESQLDSTWHTDSGSEDLFPNFQKFDAVSGFKDFPQIFNRPNTNQNVTPEISPICAREKSYNIDLSTLESTPRIKQSVQEIGKSSTRYHENILNKTVKISSVYDDSLTTLTVVESDEESNLENVLNTTHHIEKDKKKETSLNRTFGTLNLNKTLPSVISFIESPSYLTSEENEGIEKNVQYKTFTESPKEMINETKVASDPKTFELPEHSQKMLSRTVTKIKNKKNKKTMENSPNSSWNRLDSTITVYPRSSVSEADLSQTTGTRKKTFKTDKGTQKLRKNISAMTKSQSNKTKILSSPNRDLKLRNEEILLKTEDFIKKQYKELAKLRGFPDNKLSLYGNMKDIEKPKNRREALNVTTIGLVEEADSEQRISSSYNRAVTVTPLMVSPSSSEGVPHPRGSRHRSSRIAKPNYKSDISKDPSKSSDITRPQCRQQVTDQRKSSGRGYSRIPTLGQRAFGPQAIFGTRDPFRPPVRGRMPTVPKKNPGSNEPPFQK